MKQLASAVIDSLDERGFLATHPADLAMQYDADMYEVEEALRLVQSFDPPGIAARDLGECLRLQLERKGKLTPLLAALTSEKSLSEIAANRIPQLAAGLKTTVEEIKSALEEFRKLDPFPGSSVPVEVTEPEIEIYAEGSGYRVRVLHDRTRHIFIPERYEKLLLDPAASEEDKAYIGEKLRSARELLKALHDRGDTLTGIGEVLIRTQADFLESGPEFLKPLTMKQAGAIIGRDESTISRAVNKKSVQTPRGVFPLRYFFSGGFVNEDGDDISSHSVQLKLRELVAAEDPANPLSDEKLAMLLEQQGLHVARRTVAKYRDILKIPSTRLRKKY